MSTVDDMVEAARRAAMTADTFEAELEGDLLSLEEHMEGAVRTADVHAVGRVWHFESIDEFWQSWAVDQTPDMSNMLATLRGGQLPLVAACLVAITGQDGVRRPLQDLFKVPAKDRDLAELFQRNPLAHQQWLRKQCMIWLRNGSKNTGRSQQQGVLIEKLYREGVQAVQAAQRRALASMDPFFREAWSDSLPPETSESESASPKSSSSPETTSATPSVNAAPSASTPTAPPRANL